MADDAASEAGKQISDRQGHTGHEWAPRLAPGEDMREHVVSLVETVLLAIVALLVAWSGYSAAKWADETKFSLAKASATRTEAGDAQIQATQIRTLDSVSFNAALTAYLSHDTKLFALTLRRLRPGFRPAVHAWLALHPSTNPNAPPGPQYMPQYIIPQEAQAMALKARAEAYFEKGQSATATSDKYVRLTVVLGLVLFLVGIGGRLAILQLRYGLLGIAIALFVVSVVQLLGLPGPPS
jgi:hypothetical protein